MEDSRRLNAPQSVTRVIQILEALSGCATPLSLADLSRSLGTPKSSMAALLRGLADAEMVIASEGSYRLGPAAFGLGSALLEARRRIQTPDIVRNGMRRLADRSGETVLFAVRDHGGATMTYVEVIESRNPVRFSVSVGDRRPLYPTAGGRALLATDSDADLRAYLTRLKPQQLTPHTETGKRQLGEAIATARERGVAQTIDQANEGVTGTASAIRDASGTAIGSLIVAAPSSRLQHRLDELAGLVRDEAGSISKSLGYRQR